MELFLWTFSFSTEKADLRIISEMTQILFTNYKHQNTTLCLYSTCFLLGERTMTQGFCFYLFLFCFWLLFCSINQQLLYSFLVGRMLVSSTFYQFENKLEIQGTFTGFEMSSFLQLWLLELLFLFLDHQFFHGIFFSCH